MFISLKEFKQNTYKYLKPHTYFLTNHDVVKLKITVEVATDDVATDNVATPINNNVATPEVATESLCKHSGCQREGSYYNGFCMEHWRQV